MFKFLHAADIHLDSPLRGLARYDGAPLEEIRSASRRALQNLVQLALDEEVGLVILAGDVFDGDWKDYNTGLFFVSQMARLNQAKIPVCYIAGNHDAASPITHKLKLPTNVHFFSARTFESRHFDQDRVIVHGRSFAGRVVSEDWVPDFPPPLPGAFNIGMLHTSLSGYAGHETYAPCRLDALVNKGYQYWALGHVHTRAILNEYPWVVFPGNIQGRHIREVGAKGCMLISVDEGEVREVIFRELDVLRWYHLTITAERHDDEDTLIATFRDKLEEIGQQSEGRVTAVRLTISGECQAHRALKNEPEKWRSTLRGVALDVSQGEIWLEKVELMTQPVGRPEPSGLLHELLGYIRDVAQNDPKQLDGGNDQLKKLCEKLPVEVSSGSDGLHFEDPDWLRQTLEDGLEQLLSGMISARRDR